MTGTREEKIQKFKEEIILLMKWSLVVLIEKQFMKTSKNKQTNLTLNSKEGKREKEGK